MTILYLGLSPENYPFDVVHHPVITIVPKKIDQKILFSFSEYSHIIFTSKTAARLFFQKVKVPLEQTIIAVGPFTAKEVEKQGCLVKIPEEHTQEGIIELLKKEGKASYFWPKSSKARKKLSNFLKNTRHLSIDLYDTKLTGSYRSLDDVQEIVFTSPSCVDGFLRIYGTFPKGISMRCIGKVTKAHLLSKTPSCRIF